MALVLQIIGGLVLLFVLLVVIGFLYLRWRIRRFARELGDLSMGGMAGGPPTRMRLRPASPREWDAEEVQEKAKVFDDLGYDRISAYETPDMPGLKFMPFASRDQRAYALVYHQPGGLGVWCDIFTKYDDGTSLTVTSAGRGGELEHRPGNEKAYLPGSSPEQLHEVHRAKLQDKAVRPATIEGFAQDFERVYEEEMAWRASKGYSEAEIRAVAALDGETYNEEVFSSTKEALEAESRAKLTEILRRKYLAETGLSAADWEEQRDRLVIVHDKLTSVDVTEEAACWFDLDEELYEKSESSELPPREQMDWLNQLQPEEIRFRKVATFQYPIGADVWLASENV
jgi:hypothetical protein